jgi:type VI secretion system protein ImpF
MAELALQERLQPALLDRLTDDEPGTAMESRDQRVITIAKLRACILRDLSWLLNSGHLASTEDLSDYPWVERSVLNYGLRSFAGVTTSQLGLRETEEAIKQAIMRFEPRLIANTVKVKLIEESLRDDAHNTIALEIEAELWCQPLPLHMYMKTELDLEIGAARLTERSEAEARRPEKTKSRRR